MKNLSSQNFPTRGIYRWDIKNQLAFNSNKQHFTVLLAMADSDTNLKTKLTQLQMATDKSDAVLKGNKKRVIARHVDSLKETIATVNKLRLTIEAEKIAKGTGAEEIGQWNSTVENAMENADGMVETLEQWLEDQDSRKEKILFEEKAEREQIEREKQVQFELKLFEAKMKLQSENTPEVGAHGSGSDLKVEAKLPKLHIKEFNGTYGDWPRFWNLFSETIDKSSISPVNKFAYLQELLCEKAKRSIKALPHTSKGYNRAISILKDRFGKESEVVKTFVKEILELPHIATANIKKIRKIILLRTILRNAETTRCY